MAELKNENGKIEIPIDALPIKSARYAALRAQGCNISQASRISDVNPSYASSRLEKKLERYSIITPVLLRKGRKTINKVFDDFLDEKGNVKASDALTAVKMQQDRISPVKSDNLLSNQYNSFTQIIVNNPAGLLPEVEESEGPAQIINVPAAKVGED